MVASLSSAKSLPSDDLRARGRGTLAETDVMRRALVALFPGVLDGLGGGRRRHAAAGDLRGHVVDDTPDRWTEGLVEEVLVVLRACEVLGDVAHEGVGKGGLRAADHGNEEVACRQLLLDVQRDEELQELGGL